MAKKRTVDPTELYTQEKQKGGVRKHSYEGTGKAREKDNPTERNGSSKIPLDLGPGVRGKEPKPGEGQGKAEDDSLTSG